MIDVRLQQDSERRLNEIKQDINDARAHNKSKVVRLLTKGLEEEQKILQLIERVEVTC